MLKFALPAAALVILSSCGDVEQEPDTTYEQTLSSPVPQGDAAGEPVPDNDTTESGPDEQLDAVATGDDGTTDDSLATERE